MKDEFIKQLGADFDLLLNTHQGQSTLKECHKILRAIATDPNLKVINIGKIDEGKHHIALSFVVKAPDALDDLIGEE